GDACADDADVSAHILSERCGVGFLFGPFPKRLVFASALAKTFHTITIDSATVKAVTTLVQWQFFRSAMVFPDETVVISRVGTARREIQSYSACEPRR